MTRSAAFVVCLGLLWAAGAGSLSARADVAGDWNMAYTTRGGVKMASTLTLKMEGEKLTGTISSPRGTIALDEVSVTGDAIAFAIIRVGFGDKIRIDYTGTVKHDTMTLTMKAGAREPIQITAKRAGPDSRLITPAQREAEKTIARGQRDVLTPVHRVADRRGRMVAAGLIVPEALAGT